MIGSVESNHAIIPICFRTPNHPEFRIKAVIDTGFAGYLTLPMTAISEMELPFIRRIPANLADDSTIVLDVYMASIIWNDTLIEVEVLATGQRPLVGTLLLEGYELSVQFTEGRMVNIEII